MDKPYCRFCESFEHAPGTTTCADCDEPLRDYDDVCEDAWVARQEAAYDQPSLDELHRQAWLDREKLRSGRNY